MIRVDNQALSLWVLGEMRGAGSINVVRRDSSYTTPTLFHALAPVRAPVRAPEERGVLRREWDRIDGKRICHATE